MELWKKTVCPVRRVCFAVSSGVKAPKNGEGHLGLHNDVQTCEYEDVQVMWDMLRGTETTSEPPPAAAAAVVSEPPTKKKNKGFWKVFVRSSHNGRPSSPPA